jgi:hypothetical protein
LDAEAGGGLGFLELVMRAFRFDMNPPVPLTPGVPLKADARGPVAFSCDGEKKGEALLAALSLIFEVHLRTVGLRVL